MASRTGLFAAIGRDDQFRADPRAVGQRHACLGLARENLRGAGAGAEIDIGHRRQMRHHFAPQKPVGQVPAEGQLGNVGGVEIMGDPRLGALAACIDVCA